MTASILVQNINDALTEQMATVVKLTKVAAPFTTVVKRAQVTDFSKDLMPRMGIDRYTFQAISEIQGETGPNGERVWKPINDIHDAVRVFGNVAYISTDSHGTYLSGNSPSGTLYIEITFYGTGLNALVEVDGGARNLKSAIDSGALGSELYSAGSSNIALRNYASNQVIVAASGLALGMHTVRLQSPGNLRIYGYEVVTISGTSTNVLQLPIGASFVSGKKLSKSAASVDSYNSNFESGTLAAKGGHAVVYQKTDGTIGKAVQPTDASAAYYLSATHANESLIRSYSVREFGAQRSLNGTADDFSWVSASSQSLAFTLDDGVTTLAGNVLTVGTFNSGNSGVAFGNNGFVTFTFVGTGLDIVGEASGSIDNHSISVDGTVQTNLSGTVFTSANTPQVIKLASGLPYGTHAVRISRTAFVTNSLAIKQFNVYGPSKPAIPSGAVEIADYYLLATYAGASSSVLDQTSVGVLRKPGTRETTYTGTWAGLVTQPGVMFSGWNNSTTTVASTFFMTFYGTGVEYNNFINNGAAYNYTITVDGSALNAGTNTGATVSFLATGVTGLTQSAAGVVTGTSSGAAPGISRISGLALGLHTIEVTQNVTTGAVYADCFNIITPIYSPKNNAPADIANALSIGNCCLGDSRKFGVLAATTPSNWSQSTPLSGTSPTTTATGDVPIPDLFCIIKTTGNPIRVSYSVPISHSVVSSGIVTRIFVNGIAVGPEQVMDSPPTTTGLRLDFAQDIIVPVGPGTHTVFVTWRALSGTLTADSARRSLTVQELSNA